MEKYELQDCAGSLALPYAVELMRKERRRPSARSRFSEAGSGSSYFWLSPGAVIELRRPSPEITTTLSLSVENVTIRGKVSTRPSCHSKSKRRGAGMLNHRRRIPRSEDLAIEDPKGDALKINGARACTIRRVRTEWTGGPKATNGSYGIYPVQCKKCFDRRLRRHRGVGC